MVKTTPYWWDHAPRPETQQIALPSSIDVAVIGAGFTGLCTALSLARGGASVVVFEAGILGYGASTRNGGMVGPSFHKLGIAGLKSKYGDERANAILRESVRFVDYLEDFLAAEGIAADFVRSGRFRGALKPKHYDAMARDLESLQKASGVEGHMVPKSEQHLETGSPAFHGGVVYNRDGGLHPAKYHDGLVQRVREAGVLIAPETAVVGLEKRASGFTIKSTRGTLVANQIAVCTNGYTGSETQDLRRRLIPLRSAMVATEPLAPALMARLMPKQRICSDSRRIIAYYRPSPDGSRILFGGRASGLRDNPAANTRILRGFMTDIYPELSDVSIHHVWSGLVAYTFDHVPHIGQFGGGKLDGMFYAMGYCGSGVARSTYFGTKLGLKMRGAPGSETAFDDLEFEPRPFYHGNPWFMPVVLNWHRFVEKLGL